MNLHSRSSCVRVNDMADRLDVACLCGGFHKFCLSPTASFILLPLTLRADISLVLSHNATPIIRRCTADSFCSIVKFSFWRNYAVMPGHGETASL